ncbi:MAG: hypothetical protein IT486_13355 [Gammaproteobacteria bacterium]|nr:hypothetical protein [Gammaproteobacteria bacterium]
MSSCHCRLQARVLATVAWLTVIPASAATLTWNVNVAGDWAIGTNWTPAGPPAAVDIAVVNSGNPQLNAPATILGFNQGGGTLSGTGNLTVTGSSTWTTGTQNGAAVTQYDGPLAISGPGGKTISGTRTVTLNGNTTWSGNTAANNTIALATGTINNNATFTDQNTFNNSLTGSGINAFNNTGTWTKDATSTGTTTVTATFNNTGTLNVNAGSMNMTASTHSGSINIAESASIEFRNGTNVLNGATIAGAGTLIVSTDGVGADGTATINGGTVGSAFLLSGGPINGTAHVFNGTSTWTGGSIFGDAVGDFEVTDFNGNLTITGANTKAMVNGRTVNLNATTNWTGNTSPNNNAIRFWNGATVNNNGTFNDDNTFQAFIEHSVGAPHNFNNIGTYNKNGNSLTIVDGGVAFNNIGTVNINAGILRPSGGTSTGTFNIAAGATLQFQDGANVLDNVTTAGAGTFAIITDNVGGDTTVSVNGGTHTTAFLLAGSTLAGTDHVFQGQATWTGGAISGAASTTFTNDVTISGPNLKTIVGGRTVNLEATTTWTGNTAVNNNAIRFWNGATLNNNGTFNDENTFQAFIEHNVGGPHVFNNVGTYNKNGNSVTLFDLGVTLNNTGNFNVNAGSIQHAGAFDNAGTITTAAGTTFATTGLSIDLQNHGVLQGTGTYDPANARAVINAGEVRPGTATTVGDLTIAGNYTQTAVGLFQVNLASLSMFDTMDVVLGNLALDGVLQVTSLDGYNPVLGDTFTIITFDDGVADASDLAGAFNSIVPVGFDPALIFDVLYFDHEVVLTVAAVPLPPAWPLAGTALAAALLRARRRVTRNPSR